MHADYRAGSASSSFTTSNQCSSMTFNPDGRQPKQTVYDPRLPVSQLEGVCTATSELTPDGYVRIGSDPRFGIVVYVRSLPPTSIALPGDQVYLRPARSLEEWQFTQVGSPAEAACDTVPQDEPVGRDGNDAGSSERTSGHDVLQSNRSSERRDGMTHGGIDEYT